MSARSLSGLLGLLLVVGLGFPPSPAFAEGKSVSICNRMGRSLYVAVGWLDYGFPVASGWFILNINDCRRLLFPKADSYMPLFAYAFDSEGREYRPRAGGMTNNFCINRANAFESKSTTACTIKDSAAKQVTSDWESFGALGFFYSDAYEWELR